MIFVYKYFLHLFRNKIWNHLNKLPLLSILIHSAGPLYSHCFDILDFSTTYTVNMQISSLFLSLLLSSTVIAKENKTESEKGECREINSLTKLVSLASNETELAAKTNNNATKIAEIQSKASDASVQLSTLTANATLMADCAVIDAADATEEECGKMAGLQKLVKLSSNETALAEKTNNNATKIAAIQAKASEAATELSTMTSNTTLVNSCSAITASKTSENADKKGAKAESSSSASASAAASTTAAKNAANGLSAGVKLLSTVAVVGIGMVML